MFLILAYNLTDQNLPQLNDYDLTRYSLFSICFTLVVDFLSHLTPVGVYSFTLSNAYSCIIFLLFFMCSLFCCIFIILFHVLLSKLKLCSCCLSLCHNHIQFLLSFFYFIFSLLPIFPDTMGYSNKEIFSYFLHSSPPLHLPCNKERHRGDNSVDPDFATPLSYALSFSLSASVSHYSLLSCNNY